MTTEEFLPRIFGYVVASTNKKKTSLDVERIRNHAATLKGRFQPVAIDDAGWGRKSMDERPYGRLLLWELDRSDIFIICRITDLGRSVADSVSTQDRLVERDVDVVILDFKLHLHGDVGKSLSKLSLIFGSLSRDLRVEATREALQQRRALGLPYHGGPVFGRRRIRRRDFDRTRIIGYERDERECQLLEEIYNRLCQGETLDDVYADFQCRKERRAEGGAWTYDAVRKAFHFMEQKRQRGEAI